MHGLGHVFWVQICTRYKGSDQRVADAALYDRARKNATKSEGAKTEARDLVQLAI